MFEIFFKLIQKGGGVLGRVTSAVEKVLDGQAKNIRVVSVYDQKSYKYHEQNDKDYVYYYNEFSMQMKKDNKKAKNNFSSRGSTESSTCVWLSAKNLNDAYMDVVKFTGLLELNLNEVCTNCIILCTIYPFWNLS